MCGIRVQVGRGPTHHGQLESLRKRGPDGVGYWTDGVVHMAQTRLAIVGLDHRSDGPIVNDAAVLAFNGEIYNYQELAGRLGIERPLNDTTVLLAAWCRWGPSCLEVLEGFWSFALLDLHTRHLHLVRDQFGVKPLYLHLKHDSLIAGSSLDAVGPHGGLDMRAIAQYARYQLTFNGRTFFEDTRKVLPGEHIVYDTARRALVSSHQYERALETVGQTIPDDGWIDDTRTMALAAIQAAMMGDRAVTTTCSGGLDSSLVSRVTTPSMAFHANFADDECNETFFAQEAVRGTHTKLYTVNADDAPDLVSRLDDIIEDFDELSVGSVVLPLDELLRRVASRYKVALTGTGGDELLGGYVRYQLAMGQCEQDSYRTTFERTRGLITSQRFELSHRKGDSGLFAFDTTRATDDFLAELGGESLADCITFDRRVFLPALLNIDDKIGGRHGLEARPALLHQPLVRRLVSVAPGELLRNGLKWIGRAIAGPLLPASIVNRHDKMGFSTPIGTMVNANAHRIREQLHSSPFRHMYRLDRPLTAETKWSREVFGLLMLDLWLNRYARADRRPSDRAEPATIVALPSADMAEDSRKTPVGPGLEDDEEPPEPHTTTPEA